MILLHGFTRVIIFLNLYKVVTGDLRKLSWGLERNEKERLFEKFLMDAESLLMQNCPSRQMGIITPKNQLLRAATPLFKSRPCFVGTNSKVMVQSREYANKNCVFVFIDKIDYDYLSTIFNHLPSNYDTKVRILSTNNLLKDGVRNILDLAYDNSIENVSITFLANNVFKAFQMYPFTKSCKTKVRVSYAWASDKGLKTYYYDDHFPRNFNKCPVPISTMPLEDTINFHENPDGTLEVLGGPEGNLILTFAEELNFTALVKYPKIRDWEGVVNNTIVGLLGEIANKKSLIAFGQLRPTVTRQKYSDFTISYSYQCIVWTTPMITTSTEDILYSEFGIYLWIAVVLLITFSCVFIYNIPRINPNNIKRHTYIGVASDIICSTFGIPLHRVPPDRPGKIYCISYVFYAIVLTVAYRTSLASILTVRNNVQLIKNNEDIVRSGLTTGGTKSILSILQNQQDESPLVPCLIRNYEIVPDVASALDRIKHKKDLAYIRHLSTMEYYKRNLTLSGKDVHFYSFDECILSYHAVAFVWKGSAVTHELNRIMRGMLEFGLMDSWNSKISNIIPHNRHGNDVKMQKLTLKQLQSIFVLYLSGIMLCTVIMIFEIILWILLKYK
ncbi:Ionotropic receptor 136 [Cephus cinctus]|nr:Ionotropic receptor 136 [Cephus cinctus]